MRPSIKTSTKCWSSSTLGLENVYIFSKPSQHFGPSNSTNKLFPTTMVLQWTKIVTSCGVRTNRK